MSVSCRFSLLMLNFAVLFLRFMAKFKWVIMSIEFQIGHVTKTGDIAGPRVLEHIVDVVLYMEVGIAFLCRLCF